MSKLICRAKQKNGMTHVSIGIGRTYSSKPKMIENIQNPLNFDERYVGKNPIQFSEERRQHLKNQRIIQSTVKAIFNGRY